MAEEETERKDPGGIVETMHQSLIANDYSFLNFRTRTEAITTHNVLQEALELMESEVVPGDTLFEALKGQTPESIIATHTIYELVKEQIEEAYRTR